MHFPKFIFVYKKKLMLSKFISEKKILKIFLGFVYLKKTKSTKLCDIGG